MITIQEIHEPSKKSNICNSVLRQLPSWFGNEASIIEYVDTVAQLPFYTAFHDDKAVGFLAIKVHNTYTAEVCVMGILKDYHRQGIGRGLIEKCEDFCTQRGMEFLTVKTLDESRESNSYEKTRMFYRSMGFKPLEVFTTVWDESNPCLFMAKYVGGVK